LASCNITAVLSEYCSDVTRGQNLEAEANFYRLRPRPRPKIIMKKYQIMTNNIQYKIIVRKLTKFPNLRQFLPEKCPIT